MQTITDVDFGEIYVKEHRLARRISVKITPDGRVLATVPPKTPLALVKMAMRTSRGQLRKMYDSYQKNHTYLENQQIGKSHTLIIQRGAAGFRATKKGTKIIVEVLNDDALRLPKNQAEIRKKIVAALKKEAKSYLPRRLAFLAEKYGFSYERVKFTHAGGRWGGCSSSGTISLNIALMNIPFELIDHVLIHELSHTKHMNHSVQFWQEVATADAHFKTHRDALKSYTPHI